jgi:hypothetical protein
MHELLRGFLDCVNWLYKRGGMSVDMCPRHGVGNGACTVQRLRDWDVCQRDTYDGVPQLSRWDNNRCGALDDEFELFRPLRHGVVVRDGPCTMRDLCARDFPKRDTADVLLLLCRGNVHTLDWCHNLLRLRDYLRDWVVVGDGVSAMHSLRGRVFSEHDDANVMYGLSGRSNNFDYRVDCSVAMRSPMCPRDFIRDGACALHRLRDRLISKRDAAHRLLRLC